VGALGLLSAGDCFLLCPKKFQNLCDDVEIAKLIRAIVSSDVLVVSNEYYVAGYKLCDLAEAIGAFHGGRRDPVINQQD